MVIRLDLLNSRRSAIELRHFRYFVAVAEELHFGRAAERLHIVQPALTAQIKAVEQILGVELLQRSKRRVELTDAGRQFLKESYLTLAQVDTAVRSTKDVASGAVGRLRIGYGANAAVAGVMQSSIRRFQSIWPEVSLSLEEMASSEVVVALQNRELDIGYAAATNGIEQQGVGVRRIGSWPWVLAISADHPLNGTGKTPISAISGERLAVYAERGSRLDLSSVMAILPRLQHDRVHESSHIMSLMTYVASGLAVAFVPKPISLLAFPGVAYTEVDELIPEMEMNLLWLLSADAPVVHNFIALLDSPKIIN